MSLPTLSLRSAAARRPTRLRTALLAALALAGPLAGHAGEQSASATRAEVREALESARATSRLVPAGEIGDDAQTLQAREDFNALQTEVRQAEWQRHDAAAARARPMAASRDGRHVAVVVVDGQPVAFLIRIRPTQE